MEEFESITEESDTYYEETTQETMGRGENFPVEEIVTVTKVE